MSYALKKEKARLLEAVGVDSSPEQMAKQFELQSLLNDKVKNIVRHTSLSFSSQDSLHLQNGDALMLKIAHEYMERMGKINREFSYLTIDRQQEKNAYVPSYSYREAIRANHTPPPPVQEGAVEWDESHSSGLGLLTSSPTSNAADEAAFEAELKQKKKAKRKRGFRL